MVAMLALKIQISELRLLQVLRKTLVAHLDLPAGKVSIAFMTSATNFEWLEHNQLLHEVLLLSLF